MNIPPPFDAAISEQAGDLLYRRGGEAEPIQAVRGQARGAAA